MMSSIKTMVPKIIHQTWKSEDLPDDYRMYRATVEHHHPHWEHWLWTDEDNRSLIADNYAWFLPTYDGYRHSIERADAARYFILLHHGGVYIDLDMECLKPADDLFARADLQFALLAGPKIDNTVISNAMMVARKGHPFFYYLTLRLPHIIERDVTYSDVLNNTGPDMLHRHVLLFNDVCRAQLIGLDHVCDRSILRDNPYLEESSIDAVRAQKQLSFIHHHSNVWNIQHPPPTKKIQGYDLFIDYDIYGHDIDYLEYAPDDYETIARATSARADAVAFNYNGFIKGSGGTLASCAPNAWIKPGMRPWICVKKKTD
ncbi:MAG: glycosyltransferase family 32 protein [Hyphomicrobiaceae bacterium]